MNGRMIAVAAVVALEAQLKQLPWMLGAEQPSVCLSDDGLDHAAYEVAEMSGDADTQGEIAAGQDLPQAPAGCQAGAPVFHHLS